MKKQTFIEIHWGASLPSSKKKFEKDLDSVIADERKQAIAEHEAKQWHPYPKEKPKKGGKYLVTCYYPTLNELYLRIDTYIKGFNYTQIIAFCELPEPYKEGDKP